MRQAFCLLAIYYYLKAWQLLLVGERETGDRRKKRKTDRQTEEREQSFATRHTKIAATTINAIISAPADNLSAGNLLA